MKNTLYAIIGILVMIIGTILGLNALDITNIDVFFDGWWTLLIMVPCIVGFIKSKDKLANIFGFLIGVALLLAEQNVITYETLAELTVPVLVVLIGAKLVVFALTKKEEKQEAIPAPAQEKVQSEEK